MKKLTCLLLALSCASVGTSVWANEPSYTSITYKQSVWSSSGYVGDLSDWVYFGKGTATVFEYRAPESSFSFTAAVRKNEDGSSELESLVGATRLADTYIKLETGGASGQLFNPNPLEPLIMPKDKTFNSQLNILALGKDTHLAGVKHGMAWVNLVQPAQIDLTYYSVLASAGFTGAPKWADSAIDAEFSNHLLGYWIEVDSLSQFMKGRDSIMSSATKDGNAISGFALDMEIIAGYYFGQSGTDLDSLLEEAYGLNYRYVESQGLGWYVSYKLSYNYAYQFFSDYAAGIQLGIEGRAFQNVFEIPYDETVSSKDEVIGNLGIGDNDSYQWGPYVRVAMEF